MEKINYVVIVSNIGTVYDGSNYKQANREFSEHKKLIKLNYGSWSCECVVLYFNGEIDREYFSPDYNYNI